MSEEIELIEVVEVPEWGDLHLRFANEEEANQVLEGYSGSVDVIGVIYKPTGVMLETDEGEVPEMAPVSGWHVNVRGPLEPSLEAFAVQVDSPVRVWA
jgi:hypothetical protein